MELAGKIITVDRHVYENTEPAQIESAFRKVTLAAKQLIDSWDTA
jgi:hypothetical protein